MRMLNRKRILLLAFILSMGLVEGVRAQAPTITSMTPTSGPVGIAVTLTGTNLGNSQGASTVSLNGTGAVVTSWSSTSITALVPSGATSGNFTVTVSGQAANSPTFTLTALPSGWSDEDIGSVGVSGSATYANGVFTVQGGGQQVYSTSDNFHFAYQSLSGNGSIVARLVSVTGASGYGTAGVMIRETLNAGSTNAKTADWPPYNAIYFDLRSTTGGSTTEPGSKSMTLPYWVEVARSGNTFSSYASPDGVAWTQVGSSQTISMAQNIYIGFEVNSGATTGVATATFDSVSISTASTPAPSITSISPTSGVAGSQVTITGTGFGSSQGGSLVTLNNSPMTISSWSNTSISATIPLGAAAGPEPLLVSLAPSMNDSNAASFNVTLPQPPSPWVDADIGTVGVAGYDGWVNPTFTVKGAGGGTLVANSDGMNFLYQPLSGDGAIIARVVSVQGGGSQEAGVMIRETLNANASNAHVFYYAGGSGFNLNQRTSTGGTSGGFVSAQAVTVNPPYWVELVRSGSTFSGYVSYDGVTWTQVGSSQTISMAQNVFVGLFVSNRSTSALASATFDSVSINSAAASAPEISNVTPTTASVGSQVFIGGSGFGAAQNGSQVSLNNTILTVDEWSNTSIVVTVPSGATTGPLLVSVAPTMNDSNAVVLEITSQPLPTSWADADLGTVGLLGGVSYSNSTFTVQGGGGGTLITATDGFHFVYQPLSGDGTIVARVVSSQGNGSPEVGVMIRESLDPAASNAQMLYYAGAPGFNMTQRTSDGATSSGYVTNQGLNNLNPPYWVMLVRSGSTFSGYASLNGVTWAQVGSSQTITMAQNSYVGLFVSNRSTTALATGTFDNVSISTASTPAPVISSVSATTGPVGTQVAISGSGFGASEGTSLVTLNDAPVTINFWSNTSTVVTIPTGATSGYLEVAVAPSMNNSNPVQFDVTSQPLPTPWLDDDIGQVGHTGSATYASGTFTVVGGGAGTSGTTDAAHYVYQPLPGDGSIVARIVSAQGTYYPQALLMMRETLSPGASEVSVGYYDYPSPYIYVFHRDSTGASTSQANYTYLPSGLPYWVKLIRNGNTFSEYGSTDGLNWTQLGSSQTITMAQNIYVGMAADYNNASGLATATFDNVSLVFGSTPIVAGISPELGGVGSTVTITGNNFGASQGTSTVNFNGTQATSLGSWSASQIVAAVPTGATTGLVTVTVNGIVSPSSSTFRVINPILTALTPPAAQANAVITITGSGFGANQGSNNGVQFNGIWGDVTSWSDTSITVGLPLNVTSGPVTIVEDGVTSNALQFAVLEPLTVTGLSQSSGSIGTSIVITGTGFGPTQSSSIVRFYGANATVTSWSDTQITATVPLLSSSGPVSVGVATEVFTGPWFTLTSEADLTDSLGNPTMYISEVIGGSWVPLSGQGSGCSTCTVRGNVSNTYDATGDLLTHTDELGRVTTYTYDSNGNPTSVSVPVTSNSSAVTTYTYNNFGEVLTATDPLGFVTTNTYDAHGNLLSVATPPPGTGGASSLTQFAYNSLGELTQITDPLNNVTTLTYTSSGLIATIKDAQNNVTTYGYDSHGNRTSVTDALNHQTTFTYDSMDRLTKITYPDTTATQFGYDYRGRRTSVTDQNGKVTSYAYDDADRLTTVTAAASNVTTYGYDTENNLTSIQDANNNTTSFTYDPFGRVTKTTFPSGYIEQYAYDAVGNLTGKTDRKNQAITYTYDQLNRLTQKTYPDSTAVNYTYDNDSRLTQVTDPTGTYSFTFDNMGRLTQAVSQYAFLTGRNFTTSYTYDAASNRTGFTDPESGSTSYVYDTLNRLQTLTPPTAFTTGNFGFSYDGLSRRTQMTRPNSITTNYSYDNLSRLLSVLHKSGSTTLDGASYNVDNAGNRTAKTDQYANVTSNYTYDPIYELTQVAQAATTTESYTYDPVGNRTASLGVSSYTNNSSNELTATPSTTYSYDYNGNLTSRTDATGTTQYFWDFENRLTSVTLPGSGGTVQFKYDPFGRRIYKSSSASTSIYAYDGDNLIEEANSSGTAVARYSQGLNIDEPLAMLRSSATSFYNADGLGSITSLGNAAGAIAQTYTFDSFGKQTASSGSLTNPFQYTARENDPETGLYYYRARYYDPSPGRFVSADPIEFSGGLNFYSYVLNVPTNTKDSFGLCPTQVCPDYIKNFFQTLMPVFKHMADQTGADPKYFAALSSYESGWLGKHAQGLHNPFGLTNAGGNDLNFSSYSDAESYWLNNAGRTRQGYLDVVLDAPTISAFAYALHGAGYNNKTGTWTKDVINQLGSVEKWMKICNVAP